MKRLGRLLTIIVAVSMLFVNTGVHAESVGSDSQAVPTASADYPYTEGQLKALDHLNAIRARAGLSSVKLNSILTKAAENHAKYNVINNNVHTDWTRAHYEEEGKPGFTGQNPSDRSRALGGPQSVWEIIFGGQSSYIEAIDGWIDTAYHRSPLLNPDASEIGISMVDGETVALIWQKDPEKNEISVYPYDGMKDVETGFYGNESPNPLEEFNIPKSGYIISFEPNFQVERVKATITNSRNEKLPFYQDSILYYFPAYVLDYDETYTVSIDYYVEGVKQNKTWSFTTKKQPASEKPGPGNQLINTNLNGKIMRTINQQPVVRGDSLYVPYDHPMFERLGAKVTWDMANSKISIVKDKMVMQLTAGSTNAVINGKKVTIQKAPLAENYGYQVYIPARFVLESLGAKINWDSKSRTLNIEAKLGEPEDLMAKLFAVPKSKLEKKVERLRKSAEKFGYTLEEVEVDPNYSYAAYVVKAKSGEKIADFTQFIDSRENSTEFDEGTLYLKELLVPQTDESKYLFIQEAVESLSGMESPDFAKILMESLNSPPQPSELQFRKLEVNSAAKCTIEYIYSRLYKDDDGNTARSWSVTIDIN